MVQGLATREAGEGLCGSRDEDLVARLLQHEVDRLHVARGLLAEHEAEAGDVLLICRDGIAPQLPDRQRGGGEGRKDEQDADGRQPVAGTEISYGTSHLTHR